MAMFAYFAILIIVQFVYGCWVGIQPVQSQTSVISRHNLPQNRLKVVFGSKNNGSCTDESQSLDGDPVCAGTSVLNDGCIPILDGISSNETSSWATGLFTLSRKSGRIILSFKVNSIDHDRMELAVFNCPDMGINSPIVDVYFDSLFRPDRTDSSQPLGNFSTESPLVDTSCDHLLVFCVKYNTSVDAPFPTHYINLVFPGASQTDSKCMFLGEVTFLNGGDEPCDPIPKPGPACTPTTQGNGSASTETPSINNQRGPPTAIIIATVVVVLVLIVVLAVVVIVLVVVMCLRKYKQKSELQNVVLETEEEKEVESYMDDQYDGVKTGVNSAAVMDALYSNPDEVTTDETYSHLQDGQKQKVTPQNMATVGCEYSQLNYNQYDSVFQKNGPSTPQQEPTGVGMLYAVPDKKKEVSNSAPGVPEKSSELVEYLDSKEAGIVSSGMDLSECSQTDSVAQRSRLSPAQEKPTDVGMLYAIPDKKKKVSK